MAFPTVPKKKCIEGFLFTFGPDPRGHWQTPFQEKMGGGEPPPDTTRPAPRAIDKDSTQQTNNMLVPWQLVKMDFHWGRGRCPRKLGLCGGSFDRAQFLGHKRAPEKIFGARVQLSGPVAQQSSFLLLSPEITGSHALKYRHGYSRPSAPGGAGGVALLTQRLSASSEFLCLTSKHRVSSAVLRSLTHLFKW